MTNAIDSARQKSIANIFLLILFLFSSPCYSFNEHKIKPDDGSSPDYFGNAVALSGDYAAVGSIHDDSTRGAAYIFHYNGSNWIQQAKLTAIDGESEDQFGCSVSLHGDYVIVGADHDNNAHGTDSGSAYIFYRNEGGADHWGQLIQITADDAVAADFFGGSVSISVDYCIAGAIGGNDSGAFTGAAYIFYRNQGGTDNWGQQAKLLASDGFTDDFFGNSVSINSDYAVIGSYRDDDNGTDSGSSYIYYRDQGGTNNWGEHTKLTASDGEAYEWFGCSVSINFPYIVVGADYDNDNGFWSGSAYVFYYNGSNWIEQAKLLAEDGAPEDLFGYSVSISGNYAIAGADSDDDIGSKSGSAYIFYRDEGGTNNWGQYEKITASDGAEEDWFGNSVAVDGDRAIIGSPRDDDNGLNSGSAYLYLPSGTPSPTSIPPSPTSAPPSPTSTPADVPAQNNTGIALLILLMSSLIFLKRK